MIDEEMDQMLSRFLYAGVPGTLAEATFDSFRIRGDPVLDIAWRVAKDFADCSSDSRPWLVLSSQTPGTGKTHLAAAIANHRARNPELPAAKWLNVPQWLGQLSSDLMNGSYAEALLDKELNAPCLVLDDLIAGDVRGKLFDTEWWAEGQLYLLLNHRYARRLETVITTIAPMDSLPRPIASKIVDDGTELARTVVMETLSYRTGG